MAYLSHILLVTGVTLKMQRRSTNNRHTSLQTQHVKYLKECPSTTVRSELDSYERHSSGAQYLNAGC